MIDIPNVLGQQDTAPVVQWLDSARSYILSKIALFFLFYLSTFVFFAIIRVTTGVSIKRLGFLSLRHVSYSPFPYLSITISRIQLSLHRPTFSNPGWLGLVVTDLDVTYDTDKAIKFQKDKPITKTSQQNPDSNTKEYAQLNVESTENTEPVWSFAPPQSVLFHIVRFILNNAKFFELSLKNVTFTIKDLVSLNMGKATLKVDLRKTASATDSNVFDGTLDRYKFKDGEVPAVIQLVLIDAVFITVNDPSHMTREEFFLQTELFNVCSFKILGIIDLSNLALKDLAVRFNMGTLNIHVDRIREHLQLMSNSINASRKRYGLKDSKCFPNPSSNFKKTNNSNNYQHEEDTHVSEDQKDTNIINSEDVFTITRFGTILVRIIKEVDIKLEQINVNHFTLNSDQKDSKLTLAATAKNILLDLRRLNPRNPAFRLFFSAKDCAHQAIFSCNSFSVAFCNFNSQEEIIYIPMITAIGKTNVFSKALQIVNTTNTDSNNSLLRATVTMTSPSINLDTLHLPIFLAVFSSSQAKSTPGKSKTQVDLTNSTFQKLWPRAVIKFTIDEPSANIIIKPCAQRITQGEAATDLSRMVVLNCSKIFADFISSHINDNGKQNYTFKSMLHTSAVESFYQSELGQRINLFTTESFSLKVAAIVNPALSVHCDINIGRVKISSLYDEVLDSLKEVGHKLKRPIKANEVQPIKQKQAFLREFPHWLTHLYCKISNIEFSIASTTTFNPNVSYPVPLGFEVGVSNFVIDYRNHIRQLRNLTVLHQRSQELFFSDSEYDDFLKQAGMFDTKELEESSILSDSGNTDDRNLAITFEGLECYKLQDSKHVADEPFLSIPRLSLSFSTGSNSQGSHMTTNFILRNAVITWDLNLQYIVIISIYALKSIFPESKLKNDKPSNTGHTDTNDHQGIEKKSKSTDFNIINIQTGVIRIKARLPNEVCVMLESNNLQFAKNRDSEKRLTATVIRLYTRHPSISDAWSRILVLKGMTVLFKEHDPNPDVEDVLLEMRSLRIHIVNHLVVYRVLDNIVSSSKAILLLIDALKTGKLEPGQVKLKKGLPKMPKVRLRSKALFMGIEDDIFEAKLSLIFKVGLRENKVRMEKEEQFEQKMKAVLEGNSKKKQPQKAETVPSPPASATSLQPQLPINSTIRSQDHANSPRSTNYQSKEPGSPLKNTYSPASNIEGDDIHTEATSEVKHGTDKMRAFPGSDSAFKTSNHSAARTGTSGTHHHNRIDSSSTIGPRLPKPLQKSATAIKNFHPQTSQILPHVKLLHKRHTNSSDHNNRKRNIINDCTTDDGSCVSINTAREKLLENFSNSWIKAYKQAEENQRKTIREQTELSLGTAVIDPDTLGNERIVDYSPYPFLFFFFINNPDILIRSPDFDEDGLRSFLFDVGKGYPKDMPFSLLVPLYLDLKASSFRIQPRDYPLPAFHFPELHPSQPRSTTSVSICGNFIVAEAYSASEANIRSVDLPLVPNANANDDHFIAHVKRTVASVKMFTDLKFISRSHFPTRVTYCQAYQPAYQAAMQVFDTFSKPPIDPSEKLGFWDKIRSVFHARLTFHWKESDVHLLLKGSRSPYNLLGDSAGFAMVWRNNVILSVNKDDNPKKLFTITSDDYLLAVPNYSLQEREYLARSITFQNGLVSPTNFNESTTFQKVVMKLSGQVSWYYGILFEREIEKGTNLGRTFQFKPHYDITLNRPDCIKDLDTYDAYREFRSDYIHMAISVESLTRTEFDTDSPGNYNSIHLTPMVFAHFRKWWNLFDNALSLPTRNGKMFNFDTPSQKSKKFGRHLFTVKYQLQLAPLFVTHSYLTSDYDSKTNSYSHHSTGLKAKFGSFSLDLHQRRSPNQIGEDSAKRWRMHLNVGEMDFVNTDLRVLQATFKEKSHQEFLARKFGITTSPGSSISNGYSNNSGSTHFTGKIKISDNDYSWIDMDDFDELGETSPASIFPKITISPFLYSPRWSYFRQTDHDDPRRYDTFIPFGNEDSHDCIIGQRQPQDSHKIIIDMRISELEEQLKTSETVLDSLKSDSERFPGVKETYERIQRVQTDIQQIKERLKIVHEISHKHKFVDEIDDSARIIAQNAEFARKVYENASLLHGEKDATDSTPNATSGNNSDTSKNPDKNLGKQHLNSTEKTPSLFASEAGREITPEANINETNSEDANQLYSEEEDGFDTARITPVTTKKSSPHHEDTDADQPEPEAYHDTASIGSACSMESLETIANPTGDSSFINRFIVHNLQLKWNNEVRNSVSHYLARVGDRRSNAYYVTRRAVRYLEELTEKHANNSRTSDEDSDIPVDFGAILRELNSDNATQDPHFSNMLDDVNDHLSEFDHKLGYTEGNYSAEEKYLVRLTSPQIQLISDINPDSAVLVTSENIQLKIIEIVDNEIAEGDQSRLLESRYGVFLQDAQFYALSFDDVKSNAMLYFTHNTYGCGKSPMWPPWLAVECCYDENSLKEFLFLQRTSSTLRFDKPNSLRIQNHTNTKELQDSCTAALIRHEVHHQNRITVDFPKVVAVTNSKQFYAAYTIVMDLILYSEPVKKQRSEQLDRVLLTTDFNDLKSAITQVVELQKKIRRFDDIRVEFLYRMSELTDSSIRDLAKVELLQENLLFELGVMVMAIKAGMQRGSEESSHFFKWTIAAEQIIWHVLDSDNKPFVDMGLADASFNRIQGTDGYNSNSVEIGMMQAFNLEPDAVYPEMFSPYAGEGGVEFDPNEGKLVSVNWTMLDPIGGIPIMQKFEVKVRPLKIQFERSTWDKVFNFIFPSDSDNDLGTSLNITNMRAKHEASMYSDSSDSSDSESDSKSTESSPKKFHIANPFHNKGGNSSIFSGRSNQSGRDWELSIRRDTGASERRNLSGAVSPLGSITSNGSGNNGSMHNPLSASRNSHRDDREADDISLMMKRASNYMAIVDIRFAPTVLCVSHKGQGSRNILDIHEFVLNVPVIEYQNKTWSHMDLVLHLKKDITKILLTHTGALISNKLLKRHNRKQGGNKQLHQISNYVSFMSVDELAKDDEKKEGRRGSIATTVFGAPSSLRASVISSNSNSGSSSNNYTLKNQKPILESDNIDRIESIRSDEDTKTSSASHVTIPSIHSVIPQSLRDVGAKVSSHIDKHSSAESVNEAGEEDDKNGKKRSILKRLLN